MPDYTVVSRSNLNAELRKIAMKYLEVAYASDSFMRADKELNGTSTDQSRGGRSATWTSTVGSWATSKGKLALTGATAAQSFALLPVEIDSYEVEAQVSVLPDQGNVYLVARAKSASVTADSYGVSIEPTRTVLQKYIGGVATALAIGPAVAPGGRVQVTVSANTISGQVDGVTFGSFVDTTMVSGGFAGFQKNSTATKFQVDNIVVRADDTGLKFTGGTTSNGSDVNAYSLNYSTTFDSSTGWYFNQWKPGNSIANGQMIVTGTGVSDYAFDLTEGDLVEAACTVSVLNGSAKIGIYFTKGSPRDDTAQWLVSSTKNLAVGSVSLSATAPAGADHAIVWFEGVNAADVRIDDCMIKVTPLDLVVQSSTTTPTNYTQVYSTNFADSYGWYFPPKKPGASISNGTATAANTGLMRTDIKVTPGEWVQVKATATALSSLGYLGIDFTNGPSTQDNRTRLETHTSRFRVVGNEVTVTAQAPRGATYAMPFLLAEDKSSVSIKSLTVGKAPGVLEPVPAPDLSTPSTVAGAPASLKPGMSFLSPANRDFLMKNQIFVKQLDGAVFTPASGDKYAAGKKVKDQVINSGSGINTSEWNIPSQMIDTNLPPGRISEGGGGYVIRDVQMFELEQMTAWGRPYDYGRDGTPYNQFMQQIPFPIDFHPGYWANEEDGDKSAEWYDIGKDQFFGGWIWETREGTWCFANAAKSDPGFRNNYQGAYKNGSLVATGQVITPMQLGIEETYEYLHNGTPIPHTIGVALTPCEGAYNVVSWPANYSDANSPVDTGLLEGARLFIDPTVNLSTLGLKPFELMLATNMQTYGWTISDTAYGVMLRGEQDMTGQNRWDDIFNPANGWVSSQWFNLQFIPWDYVSVTPKDWGKPA